MFDHTDRLVLAASFDTDWEAHIAKGLLAQEGIKSIIDNEIMGSTLPIGFNTIGGIRLMVMNNNLQKAQEIIARMHTHECD